MTMSPEALSSLVQDMAASLTEHEKLLSAADGSPLLSRKVADKLYSPVVMQRELSAAGSVPLPIHGLPGTAAEIQPALIPESPQLPQLGDTSVKQGAVVVVAGKLYRRAADAWQALTGAAGVPGPAPTILGGQPANGGGLIPPAIVFDNSSSLAGKPAGLGTGDAGKQYYNSYFGRMWVWTGTVWKYADGGIGAGGHVLTVGPAPEGGLWQAADGSTVACALDNCTIGSLGALDTRASGGDNPVLRGGAGGSPSPATAATYVGGPSISTGNDSDAGVTFLAAGVGSTAALNPHTHPIGLPALNAPSTAHGGLEFGVSCAVWMRR